MDPIKDGSDLVIQKAASDILQCATSQDGTGADMPGTCHPCSDRSRSVAHCPVTAWYPNVYHALGHLISDISPNDVLSLASSEKKFDSTDETEKNFQASTFSTELIISGRFVASSDPQVLLSASTSGTDFPLSFPYSKHYNDPSQS